MTDQPTDLGHIAIVVGASGGIGAALVASLERSGRAQTVIPLSRSQTPGFDITREESVRSAAEVVVRGGRQIRLIIDATGFLHDVDRPPEKALRDLDPDRLAHAFQVNAIGPALLMKHFLPLLPRRGRSVFATLSARVGSIADNRIGGWYGYRASKAALNQFVRTAAVELARRHRDAICVALHPGTVNTGLSQPFSKAGLDVSTPDQAAERLLAVIDGLRPSQSGGFFDQHGKPVPW